MSYGYKNDDTNLWAGVFVLAFWLAAGVGWVLNVVKLIGAANDPITGVFILRCIGVVAAPMGAIMGYIP